MTQSYKYIGVVSEIIPVEGLAKPKVNIIMDAHEYNGRNLGVRFDFFGENEVASTNTLNPGDTAELTFTLGGSKTLSGSWFANLNGKTARNLSAHEPAANKPAPAVQHIQGATMQTAIAEWTAWKGDDKAEFAAFCQGLIKLPDGKPKPSKAYTVADWGAVVNAIRDAVAKTVAGGATSPSTEVDDMPF